MVGGSLVCVKTEELEGRTQFDWKQWRVNYGTLRVGHPAFQKVPEQSRRQGGWYRCSRNRRSTLGVGSLLKPYSMGRSLSEHQSSNK